MQRLHCPTAIGAALIALCVSTGSRGAEIDLDTISMPPEPGQQAAAPAQPPAWTPLGGTGGAEPAPEPARREENAASGGAIFTPFDGPAASPATPHAPLAAASQGGDAAGLALTVFAVLAGVGAIAWLLRRA
ncbi:MAG: hypothetical protein J7549_03260 [Variovorax sp.]|nr:hypothetical protein [Variovorax sp.]